MAEHDARQFMLSNLAESGLTPEDFNFIPGVAGVVPFSETTVNGEVYGYSIHYPSPAHQETQFVVRRFANREPKYVGPPGETMLFHPAPLREFAASKLKCIIEGEKKTLCYVKYTGDRAAVGIRGCWGFSRDHALMLELAAAIRPGDEVLVLLDGDAHAKPDIMRALGTLCRQIAHLGATPVAPILPIVNGKRQGIDDWIMSMPPEQRTSEHIMDALCRLPRANWREYPEAMTWKVKRLGLMHEAKTTKEGETVIVQVYRNDTNTEKLLLDVLGDDVLCSDQYLGPVLVTQDSAIPYNDETMDSLLLQRIERDMMTWSREALRSVRRKMIATNRRNLLLERLRKIKWDGRHRVETFFIRQFDVVDTPYVRKATRGFFMGAVARLCVPGTKWDHVLVLEGEQQKGKSYTLEQLFYGLCANIHLSVGSADLPRIVSSNWLVNCDELAMTSKSSREEVKTWITTNEEVWVPKYVEYMKRIPRPCVISATTNKFDYLDDPTGNRRIWPMTVRKLHNIRYVIENRDQIWAEALHMWDNRAEDWWREFDDIGAEDEHILRDREDPLADAIRAHMALETLPRLKDGRPFVTYHWITQLVSQLQLSPSARSPSSIADAVRRCGLLRRQVMLSQIDVSSLARPCKEGSNIDVMHAHFVGGVIVDIRRGTSDKHARVRVYMRDDEKIEDEEQDGV
jgi:hypothetical protein